MPLNNRIAPGLEEVDVIICGGGLSACVVAGRLAAADPSLVVLVIEGGEDNFDNPLIVNPALFGANLVPTSNTAIFYKSNSEYALAGRETIVSTGGLLGGGSSINISLYSRAQRRDFDSWEIPGWSTEELLPLMKRIETYHGPGSAEVHGYMGPVKVSYGPYRNTRAASQFISAANSLGYPTYDDLQDPDANNGVEYACKTISTEGKRSDAAASYLHPLLRDGKHPNLHVLCQSKVVRVLFDTDKRAVGVEYIANPAYVAAVVPSQVAATSVRARQLVVVSCGALGSPLVLERSGVGAKDILEKAGVPVVADVPGIGADYQDHEMVATPYKTDFQTHESLDALWAGRMAPEEAGKAGLMGWNACDVHAKIRPTEDEVVALGGDFQAVWNKEYRDDPNKPLILIATLAACIGDPSAIPEGSYFSAAAYTAYPLSRGHIHITGPAWADAIDFATGFFSDANHVDIKMHTWAYNLQREIMRRTEFYRGELALGHPKFPEGSKAALIDLTTETDYASHHAEGEVRSPLVYTAKDDEAIVQYLRETVASTWHSLGTCKMSPLTDGGVVDVDLNVHGVRGLKVVDLSIAPKNVGANTANTTFVIAEKGADIILKELGLKAPFEDGRLY